MKRILITGTHGFVGARAMQYFPNAIPVPSDLTRGRGKALADFVKAANPDIILNIAAISDIGACEKDPEGSYAANVLLPVELAQTARGIHAKLISFSSDQVYTGNEYEGPYSEEDSAPIPDNTYARHKLEAEQRVLDVMPDALMLRATWMYDMPMYGHDNRGNFLVNTIGAVMRNEEMRCSSQEYRGITYVRQVVENLEKIFDLPGGIYNYGSENPLNMVQTTQALLDALGIEGRVQDTGQKHRSLWMDCTKLKTYGICFDTTAEGFSRCVRNYHLRG